MNKICTTIEQSKKLLKLGIDRNTADMSYSSIHNIGQKVSYCNVPLCICPMADDIPAWSLSALLDILAKETHNIDEDGHVVLSSYKGDWWDISPINCISGEIKETNNPLDAAFEMVVCLKENGKL